MNKSFSQLLWESFNKVSNFIIGVFSLIVGLIALIALPNSRIPLFLFVLIVIIFLIVIVTLINVIFSLLNSNPILPKVIMGIGRDDSNSYEKIILNPSELFSYDSLVSIYFKDDIVERLIGIGHVINIQSDGYIQVELSKKNPNYMENINLMINNDARVLNKIIVKPSIPKRFIDWQNEDWYND